MTLPTPRPIDWPMLRDRQELVAMILGCKTVEDGASLILADRERVLEACLEAAMTICWDSDDSREIAAAIRAIDLAGAKP